MLEFKIDRKVRFYDLNRKRQRPCTELKLNNQWTIVLVHRRLKTPNGAWGTNAIEIHRKNNAGNFLVSGKISLKYRKEDGTDLYLKELLEVDKRRTRFSKCIETGTLKTRISSNINVIASCLFSMYVYGKVSIISEKLPGDLANSKIRKTLHMKSLGELSKDFEQLLNPESSRFADITLKCGDVCIPAHKAILSARSPVFAAMFANPMKEGLENEVDITDIDVSVLRALLVHLYTGKTPDLTYQLAADLLFAAEKYQLQDIKIVCSYYLMLTVSFKNVWNLLSLGDMLSENLKSFAIDYICNTCGTMSVLESTEEWKVLLKERPDLALMVSKPFGIK